MKAERNHGNTQESAPKGPLGSPAELAATASMNWLRERIVSYEEARILLEDFKEHPQLIDKYVDVYWHCKLTVVKADNAVRHMVEQRAALVRHLRKLGRWMKSLFVGRKDEGRQLLEDIRALKEQQGHQPVVVNVNIKSPAPVEVETETVPPASSAG